MASNVKIKLDEKTNIYTVEGKIGKDIYTRLLPTYLTDRTIRLLFLSFTPSKFSFYDLFLPEVHCLFTEAVKEGNFYKVDMEVVREIKELLDIETTTNKGSNIQYLKQEIIPIVFTKTPLPHQQTVFDAYEESKRYMPYRGMLLDVATGGGKTYCALALSECVQAEKIIVIAPLLLTTNVWSKILIEVKNKNDQLYKKPQSFSFVNPKYKLNPKAKFFIVSYENIGRMIENIDAVADKKVAVIVDESHNFADPKSNRTIALKALLDACKTEDVFLLSGTPIKSGFKEFVNLLELLLPGINEDAKERFTLLYRSPPNLFLDYELNIKRYKSYSVNIKKSGLVLPKLDLEYPEIELPNGDDYTLHVVKDKLISYITKRTQELLAVQEEETKYFMDQVEIYVTDKRKKKEYLTIVQKVAYYGNKRNLLPIVNDLRYCSEFEKNEIESNMDTETKKKFVNAKIIYKYPYLKANGEALGNVLLQERIRCFKDIGLHMDIETILKSSVKKALIFTDFTEVCEAVYGRIKKFKGYDPVGIFGSNIPIRDRLVEEFRKKPKANPLITTYKLMSTGIELKEANTVILLNVPYRAYIYDQTIARVWRTGQDSNVIVYVPILKTGTLQNLTTRNVDIFHFFRTEVEAVTGNILDIPLISEEINTSLVFNQPEVIDLDPSATRKGAVELIQNMMESDSKVIEYVNKESLHRTVSRLVYKG